MAGPPKNQVVADLGPATLVPSMVRGFDFRTVNLNPREGFVLSRVDGHATLGDICAMTQLPETPEILRRLVDVGAIAVPGVTPRAQPPPAAPVDARRPAPDRRTTPDRREPEPHQGGAPRPPSAQQQWAEPPSAVPEDRRAAGRRQGPPERRTEEVEAADVMAAAVDLAARVKELFDAVQLDPAMLAEKVDLDDARKRRILTTHACLAKLDHYDLLFIPRTATKPDIKRSYFRLSKVFHPDQYFRKELGSYLARLQDVFKQLTLAYTVLCDDKQRADYDQGLALAESAAAARAAAPTTATGPTATVTRRNTPAPLTAAAKARQAVHDLNRLTAEEFSPGLRRARQLFLDGKAHLEAGRQAEAASRFRGALALDPENIHYRDALNQVSGRAQAQGADQFLKQARDAEARRDHEAAARFFEAGARELGPGAPAYGKTLSHLARNLLLGGATGAQLHRAREFAITAAQSSPSDHEVQLTLGLIYRAANLISSAILAFQKVLEIDPQNERARAELKTLLAK